MEKQKVRILVIGDILIDRYFHASSNRLSQEALVPILNIQRSEERLGGAGKVVNTLASLKSVLEEEDKIDNQVEVVLTGLLPINHYLKEGVLNRCKFPPLNMERQQFHCYKNRIVSGSPYQQLVRFDEDVILKKDEFSELRRSINEQIEYVLNDDAVNITIVSDYDKGIITEDLLKIVRDKSELVLIDPKKKPASFYSKYGNIIFPNKDEYDALFFDPFNQWITCDRERQFIVRKLGREGCELIYGAITEPLIPDATRLHIKQFDREREVISTVGAGDVFISAFAIACSHLIQNDKSSFTNYSSAANFSNAIASLAVVNRYCDPTVSFRNKEYIKAYWDQIVKRRDCIIT